MTWKHPLPWVFTSLAFMFLVAGLIQQPDGQRQPQHNAGAPRSHQEVADPARKAGEPLPPPSATVVAPPLVKHNAEKGRANPSDYDGKGYTVLAPIRFFDEHNGSFNALAAIAVAFFTFFLWRITRRQLVATENTARATIETVESYRVAERAWMAALKMNAGKVLQSDKGPVVGFQLTIQWGNTGRTPAIECEAWSAQKFVAPDTPVDAVVFEKAKGSPHKSAVVGPGVVISSMPRSVTLEEMVGVAEGKRRLFIWGRVEYAEIFGQAPKRHTELCVEISCHTVPLDLRNPTVRETAITYMPHGRQNSAS